MWGVTVGVVVGFVVAWWASASRCAEESARRYDEGLHRGRFLEQMGLKEDIPVASELRRARWGRVRRLIFLGRALDREVARRTYVRSLVREGAGL